MRGENLTIVVCELELELGKVLQVGCSQFDADDDLRLVRVEVVRVMRAGQVNLGPNLALSVARPDALIRQIEVATAAP